ncbi:MAG TPA: hypothetical protein VF525_12330 [Pyrinomonadaceae bacterium]|jgi:hypothetical protein
MSVNLRALGLLLLCAASATAQQSAQRQLVVPLAEAGYVSFHLVTKRAAPPPAPGELAQVEAALVPQALLAERNTIHRVLLDATGSFIFGYDLAVEPLTAARRFKVTVKPLSPEFEQQLRARARSTGPPTVLSAATLPRSAEAQTLDDGDAFELDLLVNPQTGVRVTDVVKVAFDRAPLWESAPRDFTADSVELTVKDYRLMLNDRLIAGGRPARGCAGSLLWLYVQGRGRFIFSLVPRPGYDFQKTGMILDNMIRFDFKGEHYEWISSTPIIGHGGMWYVWVLHDPTYTPEISSKEQIARKARTSADAEPDDTKWLKDILAGKPPQQPPGRGFNERQQRAIISDNIEHVRIGAADRMENLLPKK